jgi:SAM-dependent methyltransferase
LDVLRPVLPERGTVLEIASGTGQHIVHFASALPGLDWQPSDPDSGSRRSIDRWVAHHKTANVRAAIHLDVCAETWPVSRVEAIVCINMIHISPWEATVCLMKGASRLLENGGVLFLYGPYRRAGEHTAPSNAAFDADLRARNPSWGIRDLEAVQECAEQSGFAVHSVIAMPANNLSVVFQRVGIKA